MSTNTKALIGITAFLHHARFRVFKVTQKHFKINFKVSVGFLLKLSLVFMPEFVFMGQTVFEDSGHKPQKPS